MTEATILLGGYTALFIFTLLCAAVALQGHKPWQYIVALAAWVTTWTTGAITLAAWAAIFMMEI